MTATRGPTVTFFKLKNAREYRFYNRLGHRTLNMTKDQVVRAVASSDIAYFRARPDVIVETNEQGVPLHEIDRQANPGQAGAKTFKVYSRSPKGQVSAHSQVPPTDRRSGMLPVGKHPGAETVAPAPLSAAPPTAPAAVSLGVYTPKSTEELAARLLSKMPDAVAPEIPTHLDEMDLSVGSDDVTPVEEVLPDGSTRAFPGK